MVSVRLAHLRHVHNNACIFFRCRMGKRRFFPASPCSDYMTAQ
jgi:hypothetical protein